jgi:hypothetical protein
MRSSATLLTVSSAWPSPKITPRSRSTLSLEFPSFCVSASHASGFLSCHQPVVQGAGNDGQVSPEVGRRYLIRLVRAAVSANSSRCRLRCRVAGTAWPDCSVDFGLRAVIVALAVKPKHPPLWRTKSVGFTALRLLVSTPRCSFR